MQRPTNELSTSFLFSRKFLSFSYLVPTYSIFTYEKPLFEMKIWLAGRGMIPKGTKNFLAS